jgi:hypothetical protein
VELSTPVTERLRLAQPDARPHSVDRANRRFIARALSGAPIRRYDPLSRREFDLVFEMTGADLSRFNGGVAPLLDSHADAGIASQLGVVRRGWIESGGLFAEVELSSRPQAEALLDDLERGIVRGVSLGVELLEVKDERGADGKLARRVVTRWMPYELSLVSTPADAGAVILSLEDHRMQEQNREELFDAPAAAAAAERERVAELNKIGKALGVGAEFVLKHVEAGTSVEEFRRESLEELAQRYEATPTRSHVAIIADEGDTRREGLTLALTHRLRGGEPDPRAVPYLHMRLPDAARECLRWRGAHLMGMSDARVVQLAMSTSDFPNILANVANKTLLDAYQAQPAVLRQICRQTTAADFKERRVLRFGEGTGLQYKAEGAEYTYGSIAEQTSSYSVKTFGRIFAFTREMIVNDDLGALDQFFRAAGRLAVEFEARMLADLLTANAGAGPILSDGLPLFHSTHGNVASSGGAISVSTLDSARAALRRQKGLDGGIIIDADPRYLIVPVAKQTAAEQVTADITPAQPSNVNPFAGRLAVLADPHLDDASTTAWYVAADPANVPVFEFAYLQGAQGPQTETENDFDRDILKFKVRLDVGAGVVDWRGIFRNPGA